jgi:hypothetical protein
LREALVTRDRRAIALALEGLAVARRGTEATAVLRGAAARLRGGSDAPRPAGEIPEVDRVEAELCDARPATDVHAAYGAGAALVDDLDDLDDLEDLGDLPARVRRLLAD